MQIHGFYIISDQFFSDFPDPYLKGNKGQNRPHYYAVRDNKTGLYWMIPLSSRVEKYQHIMETRSNRHLPNDTLHICDVGTGKQSVFLIGDMFPVIERYIERAYTVGQKPLILKKESQILAVHRKAMRVLSLIHRGVRFTPTQPNVLAIEKALSFHE